MVVRRLRNRLAATKWALRERIARVRLYPLRTPEVEARWLVSVVIVFAILAQVLPGSPRATTWNTTHQRAEQASLLTSATHSNFVGAALSGQNCASSSTSPLIFNCVVSGIAAASATIGWESDISAAATICVNNQAYTAGQCVINNGSANEQCDHTWGVNPGYTVPDWDIGRQQMPDGNWFYAAIVPLQQGGTFHYQLALKTGSGALTTSNDETFAVPTLKPDFEDTFGGAATASNPYFSQPWAGSASVGSGPTLFQDGFSSGSTLSSNWQVVSGTWGVTATQGVATSSSAGEAYETPSILGATAGTGELVTSVTLPATTSQYPYDNAGLVIYEDPGSSYNGKVFLVLDSTTTCTVSGSGCGTGELASGLWLSYKDPGSGTTKTVSLSPSAISTFVAGTQYTFDVRVSGAFISVFERTAPTNPWSPVAAALASTTISGSAYTIAKGQSGLWDNATSATAVQFGPFNLYATATIPTGMTPNPTTNTVQAVFNPNSTSTQGVLRASASAPLGVPVQQQNDEVDFTSDTLGGIVVRSDTTAAGDTFSVSVNGTGIQGSINGGGSSGQVNGTAPWQLKARFDGTHLSLYAQPSGGSTWQILAIGSSARNASSYSTVWPLSTGTGAIGTFSLSQITTPSLANWQTTGAAVATTSTDPNTPGAMIDKNTGPGSYVTSQAVDIRDGTLVMPFQIWNPDTAALLFRVQSTTAYYMIDFYWPLKYYEPTLVRVTPGPAGTQTLTALASFANTCVFYGDANVNTAYVTLLGADICVAFGSGLYGAPLDQRCVADPGGWTGGGVGLWQAGADIGLAGVRYYSGRDPTRFYGPASITGVGVGFGTYAEAATDLTLSGKGGASNGTPSTSSASSGVSGLAFPGDGLPLTWSRSYNSSASAQGYSDSLGIGWSTSYGRTATINGDSSVSITTANGSFETFAYDTANSGYTPPGGSFDTLVKNGDGSFTLTTRDRTVSVFQIVNTGGPYLLTKQADADGNTTTLTYSTSNTLKTVTDAVGRKLTLSYNTKAIGPFGAGTLIVKAADSKRSVLYGYDTAGNLTTVTDADGNTTTYAYDGNHLLTQRCDANNQPGVVPSPKCLQNTYAPDPNWDPVHLKYAPSGGFRITQQVDPMGVVSQYTYDTVSGQPVEGTYQVTRDPGSTQQGHLNQTATYQIDKDGQMTSFTDPTGTLTQYTYNSDGQLLTTVVDPGGTGHLNATWQRAYDTSGNLTLTTDPDGRTVSYAYGTDVGGADYQQVTQIVVDPVPPGGGGMHLNAVSTVAYYPQASPPAGFTGNPGDVYSVTDALNNATRFSYTAAGLLNLVLDADGHYRSFTYDTYGQPAKVIVDPKAQHTGGLNLTTTYLYDSVGRLQKITDPTSVATAYTYDNMDRLMSVVADPYNATSNPNGVNLTTTYSYDKVGNLLSQTVDPTPNGGTTCSTAYGGVYQAGCHMNETASSLYDADNRVTSQTNAINGTQVTYPGASSPTTLNGTTSYTYDAAGDVLTVTDPLGTMTTATYDADGRALTVKNALNGKQVVYPTGSQHSINGTTLNVYDALGRLTQVTDPAGRVTRYSYDHGQDVTAVAVDPTGLNLQEKRSYDTAGRLATDTDPHGGITSYAYDANGHLLTVQVPLGEQSSSTYDPLGNVLTQTVDPLPQGQTTGHANIVTQYVYDAANRQTSVTQDPGGTGHLQLTTTSKYDADGRVVQVTDPNTHTTKYGYDRVGRQISATDAHAVASAGTSWSFAYDFLGNQRQITDPLGNVTIAQYDALNRPIQSVVDPNPSGQSSHLQLTRAQYFDSDGNVVDATNADQQTTAFGYDALNRLTNVTYNTPTTPNVAYFYDDDGERLYMTDGTGLANAYWVAAYDAAGRTTSVTDTASNKVAYGYDANGNTGLLTSVTYPSGHSLAMAYDLDGRLTTLSSPNNALFGTGSTPSTTSYQYTYDTASRLSAVSYPNGLNLSYGFDSAGRTTSISATQGAAQVAAWSYTLNKVGNPTKVSDSTLGAASPVTYTYDEANRVTKATYNDGTGQSYGYDAAGNRTSLTAFTSSSSTTTSATYDAAGRLATNGTATYSYDNDGNRTGVTDGSTTTAYTYDQADRLTTQDACASSSCTLSTYSYNGDGMLTTRGVTSGSPTTTTSYVWDPLSQTLLSDGANEYVTGGSGNLLVQTPLGAGGGAALYSVDDLLGSTRVLTNGSAQAQGTAAYDPFGGSKATSGTASSSLGFAGQLTVDTLQYLRARYYDPSTGQFLSRDGAGGGAGNPLSLNRYAYGLNDPLALSDPSGQDGVCDLPLIGGAICGATGAISQSFDGIAQAGGQFINNIATSDAGRAALSFFSQPGASSFFTTIAIAAVGLITAVILFPEVLVGLGYLGIDGGLATAIASGIVGGITGALTQGLTNVAAGQPWDTNLGQATLGGAALGLALGGYLGVLGAIAGDLGGAAGGDDSGGNAEASASCGVGLSFSADTQVATPGGPRAISSLKPGDVVTAYNQATGKSETQPVQAVIRTQDSNLVDVRLLAAVSTAAPASTVAASTRAQTRRQHRGNTRGEDADGDSPADDDAATGDTVHTTANHPWLTADRGWVPAGELRSGETVKTLAGGTATVAWVQPVAGQVDMYTLTVANDHTFAVDTQQAVVHNADPCDSLPDRPGGKGQTQGYLDIGENEPIFLNSAKGEGMETINGLPDDTPALGSNRILSIRNHVEAKAAAIMREQGIPDATLHINNVPCAEGMVNCNVLLPHMLPEGATLQIHVKGTPLDQLISYVGLPDSEWGTWWATHMPGR